MDYSTTYTDASGLSTVIGALFGIMLILFLIILVVVILKIVGTWKVLKKAGQPGWAAIIPFYCEYCECKAVGLTPWWVLISFLGSIILNLIPGIGSILSLVLSLYFSIILAISTARSFGKSDGYAVGLVLLQPFFMLALGCGSSQYIGAKPVDPIMGAINKENNVNNNNMTNMSNAQPVNQDVSVNNTATATKYCTGCGAPIEEGHQFCSKCGKQL